jgi:hypothetical protein
VSDPKTQRTPHVFDTTILVSSASRAAPPKENDGHYLLVTEGSEHGKIIEIGSEPVVIGRSAPSSVVLRDVEMSRAHCRVELQNGELVVTDLGSTNGTYVDGKPISAATKVRDGGFVQTGRHLLRYERRSQAEIRQRQEFDRGLESASQYIQSLLPAPITSGPIVTDWILIPSARLGGDAFGYQYLDDGHFAVYLLDVSGHGADAAMHAVSVMNVLKQKALVGIDFGQPAQVLQALNAMFPMENDNSMYFTFWYGVFETATRTLRFCSGGHHPSYLMAGAGSEPVPLRTRNPPVGVNPAHAYQADTVQVPAQSTLYIFSDGVFEFDAADGTRWDLQNFLPLLGRQSTAGISESQRLYQEINKVAQRGTLSGQNGTVWSSARPWC